MGKPEHPRRSTFAERLAYARWVRLLTTSLPEESDKDLAGRIGVTPPWLAKWKGRADAPPGRRELLGLARALECSDDWLVDEHTGDAPLTALWHDWLAARHGHPVALTDPRYTLGGFADYTAPEIGRFIAEEKAHAARQAAERGEATPVTGGRASQGRRP